MRDFSFYSAVIDRLKACDLEKTANEDDVVLSQLNHAKACDEFVTVFKKEAESRFFGVKDTDRAVAGTQTLYETHCALRHVKTAAEIETDYFEKLSAAIFVDNVLDNAVKEASGTEFIEMRKTQLLGREYITELMRGLLA